MTLMRRILAWFFGDGFCPACDNKLVEHEVGYCECTVCSAVIDYANNRWQFRGEVGWRRLPGVAGLGYDEDAA